MEGKVPVGLRPFFFGAKLIGLRKKDGGIPPIAVGNTLRRMGERKWVERNGSNRPPVPWVESSPFRNWVEWTWVDLEKCQVQGRQHIDFDPSPFDPIRPQSIRPKLFDQKGRPNSFRPISFDPFHAIPSNMLEM